MVAIAPGATVPGGPAVPGVTSTSDEMMAAPSNPLRPSSSHHRARKSRRFLVRAMCSRFRAGSAEEVLEERLLALLALHPQFAVAAEPPLGRPAIVGHRAPRRG